jgi:hypothetical protein
VQVLGRVEERMHYLLILNHLVLRERILEAVVRKELEGMLLSC